MLSGACEAKEQWACGAGLWARWVLVEVSAFKDTIVAGMLLRIIEKKLQFQLLNKIRINFIIIVIHYEGYYP